MVTMQRKRWRRRRRRDLKLKKSLEEEEQEQQQEEEEQEVGPDPDLISELPIDALTSIISHLSLLDAARTSVLSSQWRHLWSLSPLDIDGAALHRRSHTTRFPFDHDVGGYGGGDINWCIKAIDAILSHHHGPIRSFCFLSERVGAGVLDSWIETLGRKGPQSITIPYYKLPPSFSATAFQSLRSLELIDCDLREGPLQMPPNIRELKLERCHVTEESFPRILSSCRVLDALEIERCSKLEIMRISSPTLRKLTFDRKFTFDEDPRVEDLLIEDAPNLELLMLGKLFTRLISLKVINVPKLRRIGVLNANFKMLQFGQTRFERRLHLNLSTHVHLNLSTRVHSLKALAIRVNLYDAYQAKALAGLLKCFPCLETLDVQNDVEDPARRVDTRYWEQESSSDCLVHYLKLVKITNFSGQPFELGFARFIIHNARVLKTMSLICRVCSSEGWKETNRVQLGLENRASVDAEVNFIG